MKRMATLCSELIKPCKTCAYGYTYTGPISFKKDCNLYMMNKESIDLLISNVPLKPKGKFVLVAPEILEPFQRNCDFIDYDEKVCLECQKNYVLEKGVCGR